MRNNTVILFMIVLIVLSGSFTFQKQESGKVIFEGHCMQCHLPNKTTEIAPSFQNIRRDYGEDWAVKFVIHGDKMVQEKDLLALYSYYKFKKVKQQDFHLCHVT